MKRYHFLTLPLLCAAAVGIGTVSVTAQTEPDPDYDDVIVLYTDEPSDTAEPGDPLCNAINAQRSAEGAPEVECDELLMAFAAQQVILLEDTSSAADADMFPNDFASETIIYGRADLNTMLSALLLSQKQKSNLICENYTKIGYACNEAQTLWVLLMTS